MLYGVSRSKIPGMFSQIGLSESRRIDVIVLWVDGDNVILGK
jgi:hypothetical protein